MKDPVSLVKFRAALEQLWHSPIIKLCERVMLLLYQQRRRVPVAILGGLKLELAVKA